MNTYTITFMDGVEEEVKAARFSTTDRYDNDGFVLFFGQDDDYDEEPIHAIRRDVVRRISVTQKAKATRR